MLNYINIGLLIATLVLVLIALLVIRNKKSMKDEAALILMIIISIVLNLGAAYATYVDVRENKEYLHNAKELLCKVGELTYIVTKDSGWYIYEDSVSDNKIIIKLKNCQVR